MYPLPKSSSNSSGSGREEKSATKEPITNILLLFCPWLPPGASAEISEPIYKAGYCKTVTFCVRPTPFFTMKVISLATKFSGSVLSMTMSPVFTPCEQLISMPSSPFVIALSLTVISVISTSGVDDWNVVVYLMLLGNLISVFST